MWKEKKNIVEFEAGCVQRKMEWISYRNATATDDLSQSPTRAQKW